MRDRVTAPQATFYPARTGSNTTAVNAGPVCHQSTSLVCDEWCFGSEMNCYHGRQGFELSHHFRTLIATGILNKCAASCPTALLAVFLAAAARFPVRQYK